MNAYIVSLLCVLGIAVGQILFKMSSNGWAETGSLLSLKSALPLLAAMALYGLTSGAWVWSLQRLELGKIYPLMALAFVLVPAGSYLVFGERFNPQYFVGVILIGVGVVLAVRS